MRSTRVCRGLPLFLFFLLAAIARAQQIEISPAHQPFTQYATVGYKTTEIEKDFQKRKPDLGGGNSSFISKEAGSLLGKKGKLVAWFGVLRELPAKDGDGTYLIENKYYDGLNDFHIQLASIYGAGDFRMKAEDSRGELKRFALVRVIGTVESEKDGVPLVNAEYIRVWNMGDYTFMGYGVDGSNPRWVKLRQEMKQVYTPEPTVEYYEKLLGK